MVKEDNSLQFFNLVSIEAVAKVAAKTDETEDIDSEMLYATNYTQENTNAPVLGLCFNDGNDLIP